MTQLWHGKIRLELFGSVSTGLYLPSSDVDAVLVVCDSPVIDVAIDTDPDTDTDTTPSYIPSHHSMKMVV